MDYLGLSHLSFAILAMISGAMVLLMKKGDFKHKVMGYIYTVCMLALNVTALMIYKLFGGFGPFHFFAVISLATLIGGIIPAYLKKPEKNWIDYHYEFMSWSVVGLYAAFWSETFTRYFRFAGFWWLVGIATLLTVAVGYYLIKTRKEPILNDLKNENVIDQESLASSQ